MLAFLVVFELIGYQTRYLVNDVRDRYVDADPQTKKSSRFPVSRLGDQHALVISFRAFLLRVLLLGIIIACVLPIANYAWAWHVALIVAIGAIAIPYELTRDWCQRIVHRDGSGGQAAEKDSSKHLSAYLTGAVVLLVIFVGFGYGLRILTGYWLAGEVHPTPLLLATAAGVCFGSTFVVLAWILESTQGEHASEFAHKAHLVWFRDLLSRGYVKLPTGVAAADTTKADVDSSDIAQPAISLTVGDESIVSQGTIAQAVIAKPGIAVGAPIAQIDRSVPVLAGRLSERTWRVTVVWATSMALSTYLLLGLIASLLGQWITASAALCVGLVVLLFLACVAVLDASWAMLVVLIGTVAMMGFLLSEKLGVGAAMCAAVGLAIPALTVCSFRGMSFDKMTNAVQEAAKSVRIMAAYAVPDWFSRARDGTDGPGEPLVDSQSAVIVNRPANPGDASPG
jgi:hypothetical protein